MTIIHQPARLSPSELPTLSMKVSLGIVQALLKIDPNLHPLIKWPNDIYVNDKKLSGILIENSLSGSSVQNSIIGIGMNINESSFPEGIPNAISLSLMSGHQYDVIAIAQIVRDHVLSILRSSPANWKELYDENIFGKEKRNLFESGNNRFYASVVDVSLQGALVLRLENGEVKSFLSHEIKWVV
jgi:BirA family biotin operon repressor/biotin-[acetyl-CoA-carboxylase] ligase